MSAPRRLASVLLRFVIRRSPSGSREWASAMLRELDFIENDWTALLWALGSTSAILRHSGRALRAKLRKHDGQEERPMANNGGNRVAGIAAGIAIAVVLVVSALSLVHLVFHFFPAWDTRPVPWLVSAAVFLEAVLMFAVVALWRKRRSMAVGVLLTAVLLVTHVIVHVAAHGLRP